MKLATLVVWLASSFFVGYGTACALLPSDMFRWVTDGELSGSSSIADFRATYGGMTIAVGMFIYYLAYLGHVSHSLHLVVVVLLCMAATRSLGLMIDGQVNVLMYVYLGLEICGAGLAAWAGGSVSSSHRSVAQ